MSENLEVALRGLNAFSRGDLEESLASLAPDVEWHVAFRLPDLPPDLKVVRGHEQVREVWDAFRGGWERLTVELVEVLCDEGDTLVLKAQFHGLGAGSGIEIDRTLYYVLRVQDGLLRQIIPFDVADDARREAGMAV